MTREAIKYRKTQSTHKERKASTLACLQLTKTLILSKIANFVFFGCIGSRAEIFVLKGKFCVKAK